MAAEKIEAQYESLISIAGTFSARADVVKQLSSNVRSKADALIASGWKGQGADAFNEEFFSVFLPRLERLASALEAASSTTKSIHDTVKAADEQAGACFKI